MTEMIQAILWALERPCPLRRGRNWQTVLETHRQLKDVVSYADAVIDDCVVEDICVTAHPSRREGQGEKATMPLAGFRISNAFKRFGGVRHVEQACNSCEANVGTCAARLWGGCHGRLEVWPHSPDLEGCLRALVTTLNVQSEVQRCFPRTTPMWFGFWMNSPLSAEQCEALRALLTAL